MPDAFAKAMQSGKRKLAAGWIRETRNATTVQWLADAEDYPLSGAGMLIG